MQPCWRTPLPMSMQQHGGRAKSLGAKPADGGEIQPVEPGPGVRRVDPEVPAPDAAKD